MIHEATYSIQDWNDVSALLHHREADAFVAESVRSELRDVKKAANTAADLVISKQASGEKWIAAYSKLVAAVGRLYKSHGVRVNTVKKGEGTTEVTHYTNLVLAQMAEAMDALTTPKPKPPIPKR